MSERAHRVRGRRRDWPAVATGLGALGGVAGTGSRTRAAIVAAPIAVATLAVLAVVSLG